MLHAPGEAVLGVMNSKLVTTLATVALGLAPVPAAQADSGRPSLPACRESAHFVIHCTPGTLPDSYLDGAVGDFEEVYARDVVGGGGDNNAGLKAPVPDDDGKTDVYIMQPPDRPTFSGGTVWRDPSHVSGRGQAAFMFMTPDLSRSGFRFRAGHEYMHVLMRGYFGYWGPIYEESLANWAAEHALPDVDPEDNNFHSPELPFDCTKPECGQGYWQWLFFQRQTEDFGDGFMAALFARMAAAPTLAGDFASPALRDELSARTGRPPSEALRARFADYARRVWDPAAWRTTAVSAIYSDFGPPAVDPDLALSIGYPATGPRTATVDHLAAHYAQIKLDSTVPDDDLRVTITPPPGMLAGPDVLVGPPSGPRQDLALAPDGAGGFTRTIPGPLSGTAILPLVNDSDAADGQPFGWHAELLTADARIKVPRQHLRTALKRGLTITITTSKPASVKAWVVVDRSTARRYRLGKRPTRITAIPRKATAAGANKLVLKFSSSARKRLAKAKRVPITVLSTGAFPRGTPIDLDYVTSLKR